MECDTGIELIEIAIPVACVRAPPMRARTTSRVLPRLPLPLEAEVGERTVAMPVESEPYYLAVADMEQVRAFGPQLCVAKTARFSVAAMVHEHEDTLAVELAILVCHHSVVTPSSEERTPAGSHLFATPVGPWFRSIGDHELDAGISPVDVAEVASFPGSEDRAHEVHVLV